MWVLKINNIYYKKIKQRKKIYWAKKGHILAAKPKTKKLLALPKSFCTLCLNFVQSISHRRTYEKNVSEIFRYVTLTDPLRHSATFVNIASVSEDSASDKYCSWVLAPTKRSSETSHTNGIPFKSMAFSWEQHSESPLIPSSVTRSQSTWKYRES